MNRRFNNDTLIFKNNQNMFKSFLKANTKLKQNIQALITVKTQKVMDLLDIHKVLEFKHQKKISH